MQSCIDDPIPDLRWENLLRGQVLSVFLWQQEAQHPGLLHVQKLTAVCLQISRTWAVNLMYWTASAGRLYLPRAACLPRPCSTGTGESIQNRRGPQSALSFNVRVVALPQTEGWQNCVISLWDHAWNGAVTERDYIPRRTREQRDIGKAGKTLPKLQMNIPVYCCKMEWIQDWPV